MAASRTDTAFLIKSALNQVPEHGWTSKAFTAAEAAEKLPAGLYRATFPEGMQQFIRAFHDWLNDEMQTAVASQSDFDSAKVREKIYRCVMARFNLLQPYRQAMRQMAAHQMLPWNSPLAIGDLGRAADAMWKVAGDRSIDYNYYTKRMLLAGVYAASLPVWLSDESSDLARTSDFVRARIDNVLQLGKTMSGIKSKFAKAA